MLSNVNIYILQKIIGLHHHKKVYIHTRAYKNNCYLSHKHYPVSYASLAHRYMGTMRKTLDNSRCENCTNCEVQRTCECSMHCNIAADKHSRLTGLRFYVPHNKTLFTANQLAQYWRYIPLKKLYLIQEKQACTNKRKRTVTQNKHKN